jgi:putative toxin-antitoxin system antitoxin component (TIGR02293 family)
MQETDRSSRVFALAEKIYASPERAEQWLKRPNPRLHGRTPAALLETDLGARAVEELLSQIDEGFFI